MKVAWAWFAAVVLLSVGLGVLFVLADSPWAMLAALLGGVFWLAGSWGVFRRFVSPARGPQGAGQPEQEGPDSSSSGFDAAGLVWFCGLAGWGLLASQLAGAAALAGVLLALAGWDLGRMMHRLGGALDPAATAALERHHLARLGLVLSAGALLGGFGLLVRVALGFWPALGLAAAAVLGLGWMARAFK